MRKQGSTGGTPPPGTEAFAAWASQQRDALKAAGWRREYIGARELWVAPPPWPHGKRPTGVAITTAAKKLAERAAAASPRPEGAPDA